MTKTTIKVFNENTQKRDFATKLKLITNKTIICERQH
jgi:hypothetical protein